MIRILFILLISSSVFAQKHIAFTVDDLPFIGESNVKEVQKNSRKLLKAFKKHNVKTVGFVNEIYSSDKEQEYKTQILGNWLKDGHELGNHTYSHPSFSQTPLNEYTENIIQGEKISKTLSQSYARPYRYFRHPYLQTGNDSLKKYGLEDFLKQNNYTAVPVTMDASDWYFNKAYLSAGNDAKLKEYVVQEYIKFTLEFIKYYENLSEQVVGRPIKHIFLLHANNLNANCFDQILAALNDYKFITVQEALQDNAYQQKDNTVVSGGFSWLHRWRISKGLKTKLKEPEIPEKVKELYEL